MTDWTTIPNDVIEAGKPGRAVDGRALRDNPVAIAEGAPGAPVVAAGWHPFDKVSVGDAATGKVWSYDEDGQTSDLITPAFEAGYEYMLYWDRISWNDDSAATADVQVRYSGDFFQGLFSIKLGQLGQVRWNIGYVKTVLPPGIQTSIHTFEGGTADGRGAYSDPIDFVVDQQTTLYTHVAYGRVTATAFRIVVPNRKALRSGAVYLYRRREFISG
ncbi:hypothetical protein [Rhodovulum sulfidophilum]|uniref:Uncharacterized protein n=1 Tax=Rhodovulum sulfidophilum TaxID=35806 RepID=A0ABS1RQ52_RHOSU|nr:hypothetical protein [Rhodovulum sulfidophilum]MBL3608200.1 hypothetical protein [Rhodovulum sulfidophilum]MCE8456980.1 hypothetical protein [Rhodovulum sulfidophilum]